MFLLQQGFGTTDKVAVELFSVWTDLCPHSVVVRNFHFAKMPFFFPDCALFSLPCQN